MHNPQLLETTTGTLRNHRGTHATSHCCTLLDPARNQTVHFEGTWPFPGVISLQLCESVQRFGSQCCPRELRELLSCPRQLASSHTTMLLVPCELGPLSHSGQLLCGVVEPLSRLWPEGVPSIGPSRNHLPSSPTRPHPPIQFLVVDTSLGSARKPSKRVLQPECLPIVLLCTFP